MVWRLETPRVLVVDLDGGKDSAVRARTGAMVAYEGDVSFKNAGVGGGGGLRAALKQKVSGESLSLMECTGRGTVHFAVDAGYVLVLDLAGDVLKAESESLLCLAAGLRTDVAFTGLQGASSGQGLFTTTVSGHGPVAVLSLGGPPIALRVSPQFPLVVDPDAYIGAVGNVSQSFVTDVSWRNLLGESSGEAFSLRFEGQGVVYVQPEGAVMGFEQVTSKVVLAQVRPGAEVLARRGAMLAVAGDVRFSPVTAGPGSAGPGGGAYGGGLAASLARGMQGEAVALMVAEGSGSVHYGFRGHHVSVVDLDGSASMSVEADRLLCHDASMSSSVVFLGQQGGLRGAVRGAVTGQGLFTTQLSGRGSVAVLSHGGTFALRVGGGRQVVVDPQAYVAHVGNLRVDVAAAVSWRDAVGRGSGEAVQLKVSGEGAVYVQASEEKL